LSINALLTSINAERKSFVIEIILSLV